MDIVRSIQSFFKSSSKGKDIGYNNKNETFAPIYENFYDLYNSIPLLQGIGNDYANMISKAEIKSYFQSEEQLDDIFIKALKHPNEQLQSSFYELIKAIIQEIFCSGRIYFLIQGMNNKLTPPIIKIIKASNFELKGIQNGDYNEIIYKIADGKEIKFTKKDKYYETTIENQTVYLYLYTNNVLSLTETIAELQVCKKALETLNTLDSITRNYLTNSFLPKGVVKINPNATQQEVDYVVNQLKANNMAVVTHRQNTIESIEQIKGNEGLSDWYPETKKLAEQDVAIALGYPIERLTVENKYNNKELSDLNFLNNSIKARISLLNNIFSNIKNIIENNQNNEYRIELSIEHFNEIKNAQKKDDIEVVKILKDYLILNNNIVDLNKMKQFINDKFLNEIEINKK